ncbi:hypothetical protein [Aneurinibacillus aneurinilyticus]|uniref:hypothetical protein n=1 Tax=Aneurinibacillus aneurinilyticus TaxID=1391 RepID=UPI00366F32D9
MLEVWDKIEDVVSETKENEIITKSDVMREGLKKHPDYYDVMLRIGNVHKRALDTLKAVRKAYKPNARFTDYGEIINRYKDVEDVFVDADPYGSYPFPWVTPVKEIGYMGDDISKAFENSERAEAMLSIMFRSREEWSEMEKEYTHSNLTLDDFTNAWERFTKLRRVCRTIQRKAKHMHIEQIKRLLGRLPRFGGIEITLNNYEMFANPIPSRKLRQARRITICEAWDCNNVFIKLDGRQRYCCQDCANEQDNAIRRFKKRGTYLPKEGYLPIREEESEKKWKRLTTGLTDELAAKVDDKGALHTGGKRKPVNVKAGIEANVAYYDELNKKQPILVTRLDFRYPWSRKVTIERMRNALTEISEKKAKNNRDFSKIKCAI